MLMRVIEENFQKICHMECWVKMGLGMHLSVNISLRKNFKNLQNHSSGDNFFFLLNEATKVSCQKISFFMKQQKFFGQKCRFGWFLDRIVMDSVFEFWFFSFFVKNVRYIRLPLCFLSKIIWFPIFYAKKLAKSLDFVF